jgi:hypothetical protein
MSLERQGGMQWQAHNRRAERLAARRRWAAVIALFVVLGAVGLALQIDASWTSIPGDAVWAAAALTFSTAVVVEPRGQRFAGHQNAVRAPWR